MLTISYCFTFLSPFSLDPKTGEPFINNVYINLGELMDLLALINNGVNFILYCTMSRAFRKTFQKTFCCNCICLFRPIKKATASRSIHSRTGNQVANRSSLPNEKLNLLSQKLANGRLVNKASMNETIDDDDGLVTINETSLKQNSSTAEEGEPYLLDGEEKRKSSAPRDTIPECISECKESNQIALEANSEVDLKDWKEKLNDLKEDTANRRRSLVNSVQNLNGSINKMANGNGTEKIANGSLPQTVTPVQLRQDSGEEADWRPVDERSDSRLKIQRNSSIDSTCNHRKLLHRHNDSRRRYRRKTIANIKSDCEENCASSHTINLTNNLTSNNKSNRTSNGCTTKNSLTTCV